MFKILLISLSSTRLNLTHLSNCFINSSFVVISDSKLVVSIFPSNNQDCFELEGDVLLNISVFCQNEQLYLSKIATDFELKQQTITFFNEKPLNNIKFTVFSVENYNVLEKTELNVQIQRTQLKDCFSSIKITLNQNNINLQIDHEMQCVH